MKRLTTSLAILVLASAGLSGCALLPERRPAWAKEGVRPVPLPAGSPDSRADDGLYADAVRAITQRDYASALDALEAARARVEGDPRVWNAFGVVYDKLGRFDLSGRYYAKAAALDPGSPIVANNRAYSRLIQASAAPGGTAAPVLAEADPIEVARPAAFTASDMRRAVLPDARPAAPASRRLAAQAQGAQAQGAPMRTLRPNVVTKVAAFLAGRPPRPTQATSRDAARNAVRAPPGATAASARNRLASAGAERVDLALGPVVTILARAPPPGASPTRATLLASANPLTGKAGRP